MATGDKIGPINIQSGKVTKQAWETGGHTADRGQRFSAPADHLSMKTL
ncbi:hypothetical protein ACN2CC_02030 [Mesorhizobium muleiense]